MERILYLTGSSKGIGRAIAEAAIKSGLFNVYGLSRSGISPGERFHHISIDLSDAEQVLNFEFANHPEAAQITLINNAATLGEIQYIGQLDNRELLRAHMLNFTAPAILMNKFIARYAQSAAEKWIINMSTGAAKNPYDGWSIYCATKAGLDMLSKVGAKEQQGENGSFRIYGIAPGVVSTAMQEQIREADERSFSRKEKFINLYREGKLSEPGRVGQQYIDLLLGKDEPGDIISGIG